MPARLNGFQRLLQAFAVSRPGAAVLARTIHRVDPFLLRVSGGRWSVPALSGVPALLLTATGARSGRQQVVPLVGVPDGDGLILIATGFGRSRTPAWSYNLRAHPECQVTLGTQPRAYLAREPSGSELEDAWQRAIAYYRGFAAYRSRAGRRIPVFILTPVGD